MCKLLIACSGTSSAERARVVSLWCLVTAAASSAGLLTAHDVGSQDLVYQLHELAERVQLPPERDYELAAMLYEQGIALDPLNAALRYNAGSAYTRHSYTCAHFSVAYCFADNRVLLAVDSCAEKSWKSSRSDRNV